MKDPTHSEQVSYLLSFLAILVHRAGGTLVIENLSSYANSNLRLGMKIEINHDRVTLTTEKKKYN